MSRDNYFGNKFGPKVNPKVQKAQDSREAKDSKRRMYQDSLNNEFGDKKSDGDRKFGDKKFGGDRKFGDKKFDGDRKFGDKKFGGDRKFGDKKFDGDRKFGEKKFDGDRKFGEKKFDGDRKFGEKKFDGDRKFGERKFDGDRKFGERKFDGDRKFGERKFDGDRKFGERKFDGDRKFGERKFDGDRKFGERKFDGDRKFGEKKFDGDRKFGEKKFDGDRKFGDKKFDGDRKFGEKKFDGDRKFGDKKFDGEKREFSGKKEYKSFKDKKGNDESGKKKFGSGIFAKEKREKENFYTEEDRTRLFGEEAFKDRVLKELSDEIDNDLDQMKREKAISESKQRRDKRENRKLNEEDYKITRYIDDEEDYEKAYKSYGGKKWVVEGTQAEKEFEEEATMEEGLMPLNKYVAHCGICSRRDAVGIIKSGKITVDEVVVTEPGFKVKEDHIVKLDGKKLTPQKNMMYIIMNKPKGFITTTDDPKGRRTVMDLVDNHIEERVFPVGRLDRNTTGLLLLTNDGDLAQQLAHPKYEIRKIYHVVLDKNLSKVDFDKILEGVVLEDGPAPVDHVAYLETKNEIGIEIHSGKNRIVRRIFESLGYVVEKLDRVMYAGLTKKNIPRGKWRLLNKQEIINLKHFTK